MMRIASAMYILLEGCDSVPEGVIKWKDFELIKKTTY
jgi:hypothetical protein